MRVHRLIMDNMAVNVTTDSDTISDIMALAQTQAQVQVVNRPGMTFSQELLEYQKSLNYVPDSSPQAPLQVQLLLAPFCRI